jgi:hypothetical protein
MRTRHNVKLYNTAYTVKTSHQVVNTVSTALVRGGVTLLCCGGEFKTWPRY